ncbi:hypothetical protein FZ103_18670 [Streptomonospora sp. PA3]|uniref:hypothetical protein n=1 Tax=Streptomonospora sp. PA3 TaxID=2607326 RepID=UPI0012DF0563|nr:hypothetical protein [Streptomonospora sp. PA3]MUL43165.1 hypothetical protein [Streptomonospora sp. PA3]
MRIDLGETLSAPPGRRTLLQRFAAITAAAGLLIGAAAGTAAADVSWVTIKQGADWAKFDANGYVTICDEEADGHGVYIYLKWETGEDRSYTDPGGADGVCAGTDATGDVPGVEYIKVCERINNWPDKCSHRSYITWGD